MVCSLFVFEFVLFVSYMHAACCLHVCMFVCLYVCFLFKLFACFFFAICIVEVMFKFDVVCQFLTKCDFLLGVCVGMASICLRLR